MPASPLPVLSTPRLTLRPLALADADAVYKMIAASRESFARWFGWARAATPDSVAEYVRQAEEAITVGEAWHYVVLTKQGNVIARVGLTDIDPVNFSAELGYMLRTDFEGRGLMAEAASALLSHALSAGGLHRIAAYADTENVASQNVLIRLGFRREGTLRHMLHLPERGWRDHHAYGLLEGSCVPNSRSADLMVCAATAMELQSFGSLSAGAEGFLTGVGLPVALAQTLRAAGREMPARILNIGIAGAYPGSGLAIGDVVIGTEEVYGDVGLEMPEAPGFRPIGETPWGAPYQQPFMLTVFPEFAGAAAGRGCTVNTCTGTEATGRLRERLFGAAFETMEGAAVAQVGAILGIPVCQIRAISNIAADRDMRPENIQLALNSLAAYLQDCRKQMP